MNTIILYFIFFILFCMPDWENAPDLQNIPEWQDIVEWQTDKLRMERLNREIFNKTQELQTLNIDTISSVEFWDITKEIRSYKAELDEIRRKDNPDDVKQLNQLDDDYAKLMQIYNQLDQQLAQTNADLHQLSNDTIASQNQVVQNQETPEQSEPEEKWLKKWWHWLTKWQQVWVGLGWAAVWIWIFSLFRRRKKKKEGKSSESAWSKKSFWERPIWKAIKWTTIWWSIYYVVHWLVTGKRNPKDLWERWRDRIDDSISQVSAYEKLSKEQREQYEKIWNGVNDMYWKIREKEISLWFEDKNKLWTISNKIKFKEWQTEVNYAWLVPFCMDKDSDNIKEILSEKDMNEYFFNKDISELKNKIKWWTTEKLERLLWPFVDKLQSFQVFGSQPGASLWEKIRKWLDYDSEERDAELDFFFRQYSKVLVFLKDKETTLKYKIAENVLKTTGYDWQSLPEDEDDRIKFIQEVLEDGEWVKSNIENNDVYKKFMESKLISVNKFLESQNIPCSEISEELEKRLEDLDDDADDILQIDENNSTIVDRWLSEISWWLSDKTGKNLMEMCDDIQEDMANETWTWFIQEYFEWLTYVCNTEDSNREDFLKESWLLSVVEWMSSVMNWYKEKIKNKTITADDLQKLKQVSLEYMALKKEIEVAMYTMKSIKSDDPDAIGRTINTWFKFIWWFCNSVQNIIWWEWKFGDWLNVWISIAIVSGTIWVVKHPLRAAKGVLTFAAWTVWTGLRAAGWAWWRTLLTSRWLGMRMKTLASKWVTLIWRKSYFLHYLSSGQAREQWKLLKLAKQEFWYTVQTWPELIQNLCKDMWETLTLDQAKMVRKYWWDKNLRNIFMTESTDWAYSTKKDILLHNKTARKFKFHNDVLTKLKELDSTIDAMDEVAGKWMKKLLKWVKEVEDLSTLKVLAKNENFVNQLKTLNRAELRQFRKHLKEFRGEKLNKILTWELKIKDAVAPFMRNGWRQAVHVTENSVDVISDARKIFNARIDKEIAKVAQEGGDYAQVVTKRISQLKDIPLNESEIKWFTQFLDEWFDVKYIRELKWLCDIDTMIKGGKKLWPELKKLLEAWDYSWFKQLLNKSRGNKAVNKALSKINCDGLIKHIDDIAKFKKLWSSVWCD